MFEPAAIEKVQEAFMAEVPPHDGHRRNILKAWHTHVGVGLAKARGLDVACMAQEFVDRYGSYEPVPKQGKVGQNVRVEGQVDAPAKFVGVGIARVALPKPRDPKALLATGGYPIPAPFETFFPAGYVTRVPVQVNGRKFKIEVPLRDKGGALPGLYELSVWAEVPGTKDYVMVSLRTVQVP